MVKDDKVSLNCVPFSKLHLEMHSALSGHRLTISEYPLLLPKQVMFCILLSNCLQTRRAIIHYPLSTEEWWVSPVSTGQHRSLRLSDQEGCTTWSTLTTQLSLTVPTECRNWFLCSRINTNWERGSAGPGAKEQQQRANLSSSWLFQGLRGQRSEL